MKKVIVIFFCICSFVLICSCSKKATPEQIEKVQLEREKFLLVKNTLLSRADDRFRRGFLTKNAEKLAKNGGQIAQ